MSRFSVKVGQTPVRTAGVDVSDADRVDVAVAETVKAPGGLDIVVADAGIGGESAPSADYSDASWRKVISVTWTASSSPSARRSARCRAVATARCLEEVAGLVAWLASDAASFVTGGCYAVDGDLARWRMLGKLMPGTPGANFPRSVSLPAQTTRVVTITAVPMAVAPRPPG